MLVRLTVIAGNMDVVVNKEVGIDVKGIETVSRDVMADVIVR